MNETKPEDIEGVNIAREFLGVDQEASDREIERTFDAISENVQGETYWAVVKAREIALSDSLHNGTTVYNVLRKDVHPEDLSSVADAQRLFGVAPPPEDSKNQTLYNSGIAKTAEWAENRLRKLAEESDLEISESNVQTVRVAYHALRLRDIEEGKRYVLGPN